MVAHAAAHRIHRRQDIEIPTGVGIATTAATVAQVTGTFSSLFVDESATRTSVPTDFVPQVVDNTTPATILSAESTGPSDTSTVKSTSKPSDESSNEIPIGTVIGACVGALGGAAVLILIGVWLYKRSSPKSSKGALSASRNARGEHARSRSRLEPWSKLEEGRDGAEDKYQMKEVDRDGAETVAPMEKLGMFKKSPSIRTAYTAYTHKLDENEIPPFNLDPHPFAQYHPNLAQEMASSEDITQAPKPFAREGTNSSMSWHSIHESSTSTLRQGPVTGEMSPVIGAAIPTPSVTSSEPHRWETAEVINFDGQTAEVVDPSRSSQNPFMTAVERRKSDHNPFFGASQRVRSVSTSSRKGKQRGFDSSEPTNESHTENPFNDAKAVSKPAHTPMASTDSVASNDRAIQSLLKALDVSPADVEERLRVASMQPSVISEASEYTNDDDVTDSFPLPPTLSKKN